MAWETFDRKMRPSPKSPTVTLSHSGRIGLNAAVVRNIVGECKYAILMFDRDKALIGIKFSKQNEPNAYPIKVTDNKSSGGIAGTAFLKTFNIFPSETKNYPASYDEHNKILMVNVAELRAGRKQGKS